MGPRRHSVLCAALLAGLMAVPQAAAYLDPGTGAIILQLLVAGLAGALFAFKKFWKRVIDRVRVMFGKEPKYFVESHDDGDGS